MDPRIPIMQQMVVVYQKLIALLMPPQEKLVWTDPESARHAVRVLCDRAGLSVDEKNIISRCIRVESGFKNSRTVRCENRTKDGTLWSTDWGIVQCNDRYWIGPGKLFPSVDWVLANPERMVKWMIQCYKRGDLDLWSSYKFGAYLKVQP